MPRALITGISGQDGSYLAELLLARGYEVHGLVRRAALEAPEQHMPRLAPLLPRLRLHAATLESFASVARVLAEVEPDECYHLAAQSFVACELEEETATLVTNITSTQTLLAAIVRVAPRARLYFAGSSEMFGSVGASPQDEETPFRPRSAYGISKLAGYHLVRSEREQRGLHACTGILYNHESPRRGFEFVSRKITRQVARIKLGLAHELVLGNLEARRDWGHARDYVRAMWLMLQQGGPDDYVIATGRSTSVAELAALAFAEVGLDWRDHVVSDPRFHRPAEGHSLVGDAGRARAALGWEPTIPLEALVAEMVEADLAELGGRVEVSRGAS